MNLEEWDERYRTGSRAAEDRSADPSALVVGIAEPLPPGRALDLACGAGRNAIWLAQRGWSVTAVDGSAAAIDMLGSRASGLGVAVEARVADLEQPGFEIEAAAYDLICMCYYLQRDLLPRIRDGLRPGGIAIVIAHTPRPGEEVTKTRAAPGELRRSFQGFELLHCREGEPRDSVHHRPVAEIAARRIT